MDVVSTPEDEKEVRGSIYTELELCDIPRNLHETIWVGNKQLETHVRNLLTQECIILPVRHMQRMNQVDQKTIEYVQKTYLNKKITTVQPEFAPLLSHKVRNYIAKKEIDQKSRNNLTLLCEVVEKHEKLSYKTRLYHVIDELYRYCTLLDGDAHDTDKNITKILKQLGIDHDHVLSEHVGHPDGGVANEHVMAALLMFEHVNTAIPHYIITACQALVLSLVHIFHSYRFGETRGSINPKHVRAFRLRLIDFIHVLCGYHLENMSNVHETDVLRKLYQDTAHRPFSGVVPFCAKEDIDKFPKIISIANGTVKWYLPISPIDYQEGQSLSTLQKNVQSAISDEDQIYDYVHSLVDIEQAQQPHKRLDLLSLINSSKNRKEAKPKKGKKKRVKKINTVSSLIGTKEELQMLLMRCVASDFSSQEVKDDDMLETNQDEMISIQLQRMFSQKQISSRLEKHPIISFAMKTGYLNENVFSSNIASVTSSLREILRCVVEVVTYDVALSPQPTQLGLSRTQVQRIVGVFGDELHPEGVQVPNPKYPLYEQVKASFDRKEDIPTSYYEGTEEQAVLAEENRRRDLREIHTNPSYEVAKHRLKSFRERYKVTEKWDQRWNQALVEGIAIDSRESEDIQALLNEIIQYLSNESSKTQSMDNRDVLLSQLEIMIAEGRNKVVATEHKKKTSLETLADDYKVLRSLTNAWQTTKESYDINPIVPRAKSKEKKGILNRALEEAKTPSDTLSNPFLLMQFKNKLLQASKSNQSTFDSLWTNVHSNAQDLRSQKVAIGPVFENYIEPGVNLKKEKNLEVYLAQVVPRLRRVYEGISELRKQNDFGLHAVQNERSKLIQALQDTFDSTLATCFEKCRLGQVLTEDSQLMDLMRNVQEKLYQERQVRIKQRRTLSMTAKEKSMFLSIRQNSSASFHNTQTNELVSRYCKNTSKQNHDIYILLCMSNYYFVHAFTMADAYIAAGVDVNTVLEPLIGRLALELSSIGEENMLTQCKSWPDLETAIRHAFQFDLSLVIQNEFIVTGLPLLLDIVGRTIRKWTTDTISRYAVPFLILCLNMRDTKRKGLAQRVLKVLFGTILEMTRAYPEHTYTFLQSLIRNMAGISSDQQMVFITFLTNKITALHPCVSVVQLVHVVSRAFASFGSANIDKIEEKTLSLSSLYRLVNTCTEESDRTFPTLDVLNNSSVVRVASYQVVILLEKAKKALERMYKDSNAVQTLLEIVSEISTWTSICNASQSITEATRQLLYYQKISEDEKEKLIDTAKSLSRLVDVVTNDLPQVMELSNSETQNVLWSLHNDIDYRESILSNCETIGEMFLESQTKSWLKQAKEKIVDMYILSCLPIDRSLTTAGLLFYTSWLEKFKEENDREEHATLTEVMERLEKSLIMFIRGEGDITKLLMQLRKVEFMLKSNSKRYAVSILRKSVENRASILDVLWHDVCYSILQSNLLPVKLPGIQPLMHARKVDDVLEYVISRSLIKEFNRKPFMNVPLWIQSEKDPDVTRVHVDEQIPHLTAALENETNRRNWDIYRRIRFGITFHNDLATLQKLTGPLCEGSLFGITPEMLDLIQMIVTPSIKTDKITDNEFLVRLYEQVPILRTYLLSLRTDSPDESCRITSIEQITSFMTMCDMFIGENSIEEVISFLQESCAQFCSTYRMGTDVPTPMTENNFVEHLSNERQVFKLAVQCRASIAKWKRDLENTSDDYEVFVLSNLIAKATTEYETALRKLKLYHDPYSVTAEPIDVAEYLSVKLLLNKMLLYRYKDQLQETLQLLLDSEKEKLLSTPVVSPKATNWSAFRYMLGDDYTTVLKYIPKPARSFTKKLISVLTLQQYDTKFIDSNEYKLLDSVFRKSILGKICFERMGGPTVPVSLQLIAQVQVSSAYKAQLLCLQTIFSHVLRITKAEETRALNTILSQRTLVMAYLIREFMKRAKEDRMDLVMDDIPPALQRLISKGFETQTLFIQCAAFAVELNCIWRELCDFVIESFSFSVNEDSGFSQLQIDEEKVVTIAKQDETLQEIATYCAQLISISQLVTKSHNHGRLLDTLMIAMFATNLNNVIQNNEKEEWYDLFILLASELEFYELIQNTIGLRDSTKEDLLKVHHMEAAELYRDEIAELTKIYYLSMGGKELDIPPLLKNLFLLLITIQNETEQPEKEDEKRMEKVEKNFIDYDIERFEKLFQDRTLMKRMAGLAPKHQFSTSEILDLFNIVKNAFPVLFSALSTGKYTDNKFIFESNIQIMSKLPEETTRWEKFQELENETPYKNHTVIDRTLWQAELERVPLQTLKSLLVSKWRVILRKSAQKSESLKIFDEPQVTVSDKALLRSSILKKHASNMFIKLNGRLLVLKKEFGNVYTEEARCYNVESFTDLFMSSLLVSVENRYILNSHRVVTQCHVETLPWRIFKWMLQDKEIIPLIKSIIDRKTPVYSLPKEKIRLLYSSNAETSITSKLQEKYYTPKVDEKTLNQITAYCMTLNTKTTTATSKAVYLSSGDVQAILQSAYKVCLDNNQSYYLAHAIITECLTKLIHQYKTNPESSDTTLKITSTVAAIIIRGMLLLKEGLHNAICLRLCCLFVRATSYYLSGVDIGVSDSLADDIVKLVIIKRNTSRAKDMLEVLREFRVGYKHAKIQNKDVTQLLVFLTALCMKESKM
jgi:hypothetical protein